MSRYLPHKLLAPWAEIKLLQSQLVYSQFTTGFVSIIALRAMVSERFLTAWRHYLPFPTLLVSSTDCSVEWADLFVFVSWTERLPDLWPRVFWECAGHDRNLDSGGTKVAFVSFGQQRSCHVPPCVSILFSLLCEGRHPNNPFFGDLFHCMRLGPVDFISACVFLYNGPFRESCDRQIESGPVISTQMRLRRRPLLSAIM